MTRLRRAMAPAWGAEVVSSNIVGYDKITINEGFNMIGAQFLKVGGSDLDLSTVGTLDSQMPGFDSDGNYDTELRVWNGRGYEYYGWSGTSGTDVLEDSTLDNKWLNGDLEEPEDETVSASGGFWIKAGTSGTITISGEVPSASSIEVPLIAGFNLVANPFPADVKLSEFGQMDSSYPGFDSDGNFAAELRTWNGRGYEYYGWSGTSGTDVLEDSSLDNKWLNGDLEEEDDTKVLLGHAVWIKTEAAGKITFTSPIAE